MAVSKSSVALAANTNPEPTAFKRDLDPVTAPSANPEELKEVGTSRWFVMGLVRSAILVVLLAGVVRV